MEPVGTKALPGARRMSPVRWHWLSCMVLVTYTIRRGPPWPIWRSAHVIWHTQGTYKPNNVLATQTKDDQEHDCTQSLYTITQTDESKYLANHNRAQHPGSHSFTNDTVYFTQISPVHWPSKQSWGWWFEIPSHPLCRQCNELYA